MDSASVINRELHLQKKAAVRYSLRLPVIFHWNDGTDHIEGGFTTDVAIDGAFILTSKCPSVGSDVRLEVLLPSPDQSDCELRIECVGKVTEVVSEAGCRYFGVRGVFDDDHLTRRVISGNVMEAELRRLHILHKTSCADGALTVEDITPAHYKTRR